MGNTEISDTDTDTDTAETALSVPLPPPAPEIRIPHPTYPLSRVPSPESCWIPNRTAQFAQLCDDNGKHFYCVSTSLSLSFFFLPFFAVPFDIVVVVVASAVYIYLLQVFVRRFTASISIFGPSARATAQKSLFFCPLWHGRFYTLPTVLLTMRLDKHFVELS